MTVRRRTFVRNLLAMPREEIERRTRVLLRRDQVHGIGGTPIVLPPDSRLPYYQWRDGTYDVYAAQLLAAAALGRKAPVMVDIGGNVGDTAVLALAAASNLRVISVEGSPYFLKYLTRNVASFGPRAQVVQGFVGPIANLSRYSRNGGTGGFQRNVSESAESMDVSKWISVPELLARAQGDLVVWKTDTDGFDIHLVSEYWDDIVKRCDVIWMEFDPVGTLGPPQDIESLMGQIAASRRELHVYDNVGHHMCSGSGPAAARLLHDLTDWVRVRREGFAPVLYFDIWIATPDVATVMWP